MCFSLKKNSEHLAARDVLSVMAFEHRHRHHNVLYWFLSGVRLWHSIEKTQLFIQTKTGRPTQVCMTSLDQNLV